MEKITLQLRQLISERAAILGLDEIEPQQLYHEALGEANRELGQLNNRLQQQNYKLKIRSSYFDLLGKLAHTVRPGQTVVDACGLVAGLWQEQIGSAGCAVYATDKDGVFIEGAMKHNSGDAYVSFIVDRSEDPDFVPFDMTAELSTGLSITQVAPQDSWFFEQVNPDFEIESTRTIPLRLGDKIIGGILWQSGKPDDFYQEQLKEIEAFTVAAALILRQEQLHQEQTLLCEQLAQSNEQLQKVHQELLRKRNLASVGEMAAGAAHEINNPLAVIMGRTQLLVSSETNPQRKESLELIVRRTQQITDIITELMEFARPAQPAPKTLAVSELINQAQKVVNKKLQPAKNIILDAKLSDTLPDVFVDGKQVSDALAELILNAIESYKSEDESGSGTVTITAGFNELENEVMLEIIDTGCGMDSQTLAKAADPFFSSKPAGRQRGLGLSRSIRNIESNAGTIRLESELDRGTVVRVMLPVAFDGPITQTAENSHAKI
jgi:signal transduction histidine kinase